MKLSSTTQKIQAFFQNTEEKLHTEINFISKGTKLKGDFVFESFTRIHGEIKGNIRGLPGSLIVIGEEAKIKGKVYGEDIIIDGFVQATVQATGKVSISGTGTLIGDLISDRFEMEFGAKFEGRTTNIHGSRTNLRDC